MSILQKHTKNLRKAVKDYYDQYQTAKADLDKAEAVYKATAEDAKGFARRNSGASLEIARANALTETRRVEMEEAKKHFQTVRKARFSVMDKVAQIRQELVSDVQAAFLADPAQVDTNTMTLINSGILKAADYEKLFNDAQTSGNMTMCRLIAQAAGNLAKTASDTDRVALNMLTHKAAGIDGRADLQAFDESVISLSFGIGDAETGRTENMDTVAYWLDSTADGDQDT